MILSPQSSQLHSTGSRMHIQTISRAEDWDALAGDWNPLLEESHQKFPFLTYEFQRAWWQHLGGAEWKDAQLNILVGRNEDERLIGIAPLFRTPDGALQFIGSHEIADFLDVIVRPADHAPFLQAVLAHLAANAGDWRSLELNNLVDRSATSAALQTLAGGEDWTFELKSLQPSPYLPIPASMDAYIDSLGAKQAHELRRKLRRAVRNPESVTFEIITREDELDAALQDFFALMAREAHKMAFLHPAMRVQMDAIARVMFAAGWLQLAFLKAGEKRIAGYMNFDYANSIWAYNAGFDSDFASLSPGWLIMAEMVRWCTQNGRKVFDFMRGDEEYKYRFGGVDRFVQRVTITRNK